MNRALFVTTLLSLAVATPALAQTTDWSGLYIGGAAGYANPDEDDETLQFDRDLDGAFNDTVTTSLAADAFAPGFCNGTAKGNNAGAGCRDDEGEIEVSLRGGYDRQFGNWVVGGLVEATYVNLEDAVTGFSSTPAAYTFTRETDWILAARVRGGYASGPYLAYATAGLATAKIDTRFDTTNVANAFELNDSDSRANGYQLGGGLEWKVNSNWSLGAEYLYTTLEDDDAVVRVTQGAALPSNPFVLAPNTTGTDIRRSDDEFDIHSFRVTAAYRF